VSHDDETALVPRKEESETGRSGFVRFVLRSRNRVAGLIRTFAAWIRGLPGSRPVQRVTPTVSKAFDALDAKLARESLKTEELRASIALKYAEAERTRAEAEKLLLEASGLRALHAARARRLNAETDLMLSRTHLERLLKTGKVRLVTGDDGTLSLLFDQPLTTAERLVVMDGTGEVVEAADESTQDGLPD